MNETPPQLPKVIVPDLFRVTIPNWKQFNPRSDRVNFSWFRMENRFFEDQSIFFLNDTQKILYLFLLCMASKTNTETIEIRSSFASSILRRDVESVINDFFLLCELKLIMLQELDSPHPVLHGGGVTPSVCRQNDGIEPSKWLTTRRDETGRDETVRDKKNNAGKKLPGIRLDYPEDFNEVWIRYERKGDKKAAFEAWKALRLSPNEIKTLNESIDHEIKAKPDAIYRKDLERFLKTDWRECSYQQTRVPKTADEVRRLANDAVIARTLASLTQPSTEGEIQ